MFMEFIMSDCEIFLSRLAGKDELFIKTAEKLGFEGGNAVSAGTLEELLSDVSVPSQYKIYVSDENIQNDYVTEITDIFKNAEKLNSNISLEIVEDEFLNIIDSEDRITSESKPRSLVHRDGDLHPTVHVWVIKRMDMGIYVLLQKRAETKDTHPGCYDVSAAGHVSQGDEFRESAVREINEELGLDVMPEKLDFIGLQKCSSRETTKSGSEIIDNELSAVYLYRRDVDIDELVLQASEVSEVCWAEVDELLSVMNRGDFKNCIYADELRKIKKAIF